MKRYKSLLIVVAALLCLSAVACTASTIACTQYAEYKMQQGWYDGGLVWYIATDAGGIKTAGQQCLTLAPLLQSAVGEVPLVWFVNNPPSTQGPVFQSAPGDAAYAGLVEINLIDWNSGFTPVPITSQSQIQTLVSAGAITVTDTGVIANYPVVAIGPLGGAWLPQPPGTYRIPEGEVLWNYVSTKLIYLPLIPVVCGDMSGLPVVRDVVVTDASDSTLATMYGANVAPGLLVIDSADVQDFWTLLGLNSPAQLQIVAQCPSVLGVCNNNFNYTPIMQYITLNRNIAPYTTVNTLSLLEILLGNGGLTVNTDDEVVNAPAAVRYIAPCL